MKHIFPSPLLRPTLILLGLTLSLACWELARQLPGALWWQTLFAPNLDDARQAVVHFSWLPRLTVTLLAGAALGLAGTLMQQVLRNPLASPTTLGVASGAQLALMMVTLFAPSWLLLGREWIAMAGGSLAMALVFALAWRRQLNPVVIVFAGLVINLYLAAISMGLLLFFQEELKGLLVWGSGSLAQNSWSGVHYLLPRLLVAGGLAAALVRPLAVLELDDASARSLGGSLQHLRLAGLGLAVFVTACVVSVVGLIGFIGLAAPAMVRLLGIRQLGQRLLWAPVLGALLLAATDLLLQSVSRFWPMLIPTGAMTALLGAPLLLWLIPRLSLKSGTPKASTGLLVARHPAPTRLITLLLLGLGLAIIGSLLFGQGMHGWSWPSWLRWQAQLEWRLPRTLAAGAAGILLALAGTLLQRVSNNPMASPELLGVSGGTFMGVIATALLLPALPLPMMLLGGLIGAFGCLLLLVLVNRKHGFQPERILLSGIAITALFEPLQAIALANGDMRVQQLLSWMSGSTYYVTLPVAYGLVALAVLMLAACLLISRWLDLLPMGPALATALGIRLNRAQLAILLLVAVLTASATLVVGPLSFVGLLAPHMAKLMGLVRARWHLLGAAASGALLMVSADWIGQQILFPQDVPVGLVSTLLGGAYFMWCLRRL
ncbi:TPA: Fe(3+)-hydroxamate ABC transporter permease FhuB [Aeromonas salmonicida]|uniref:ABC-type hydroxamate-type ferric siderophore transporter, permease protein n=2 Tax=Aeromonas salmonicida subsp. salmonicida TaxID=29491 RepID=A4STR0_AERS4|nr:Fe(3+)-hydroxamate ABC transporter permease FhuB [Aeromonas salmonicida]ABO92282.1 ABC-type hydroxamate-type ferric siderophore transporter, permease protein [Aeromonas salmonicida subsp. salmonicida A449]AYO65229.1 Fe(3+)-hydroxamate ABC transporter permease FhuB [Aeromonas salmonicida subsp. salmonicida 01-B526]EHI50845.1 iron-hydroxamate transporter permease subunit [Aeromonas salmonicida subsp. salmonicida 01-B526]EKP0239035.1 Fe(3+)-hydroxamate ABC transporter permease FhuB [Aeromonas s